MHKKILVGHSRPESLKPVQNWLEMESHEVFWASNSQDILAWARKNKPDLIILDTILSDSQGWEICHILKKEKLQSWIIIVANRLDALNVLKVREAGADDFVLHV